MNEIERFDVNTKIGLTEEQVNKRIERGLTNINQQPQTKSIKVGNIKINQK